MREYLNNKTRKTFLFFVIMCVGISYLFLFSLSRNKITINAVFNQSKDEKQIDKNTDYYKISLKYPSSSYKKLDKKIEKFIERKVNDFNDFVENESVSIDREYQLIITYDSYLFNEYISYVFHIFTDFGGAHPTNQLYTIVYNKDTNKIVNIESLITYNINILNDFSRISREQLIKNDKIVSTSMMMDGTKPLKKNFSNFVFSKDGLIIFFETYQVAPYSSGEFQVLIDYKTLKSVGIIV